MMKMHLMTTMILLGSLATTNAGEVVETGADSVQPEFPEITVDGDAPPIELFLNEPSREVDMSDWDDPAMNRMVDFGLLGRALEASDARSITDVAMQLAEAERILLRNHDKITSAQILKIAMGVAQKTDDKKTLARIAKAAKLSGNAEFTKDVEVAMTLGGESRAIIAPPPISLDTDPEQLRRLQELTKSIEIAENTMDTTTLRELRLDAELASLPEGAQEWVGKLIDRGIEEIGDAESDTASDLTMLAGSSRGGWLQNATGGRVSTPRPIRQIAPNGISFRLKESESQISPPPGTYNRSQRPQGTSSTGMRNMGYKKYNNVNIASNGRVTMNGQYVGNADRKYNSATGLYYYEFYTRQGSRVVRQANGQVWARQAR